MEKDFESFSSQWNINDYLSIIDESCLTTFRFNDIFQISLECANIGFLFFPFNIKFKLKPEDDQFERIETILDFEIKNIIPEKSLRFSKNVVFRYPDYTYIVKTGLTQQNISNIDEGWLESGRLTVNFKCTITSQQIRKSLDFNVSDSEESSSSDENNTQIITKNYFDLIFVPTSEESHYENYVRFKEFEAEFRIFFNETLQIGVLIQSPSSTEFKYNLNILNFNHPNSKTVLSKTRRARLYTKPTKSVFYENNTFDFMLSYDELSDYHQGWRKYHNGPIIIRFKYYFIECHDLIFKYPSKYGRRTASYGVLQRQMSYSPPIHRNPIQSPLVHLNPLQPYKNTSKEDTGYVGLQNQGATCYMNSLLQSLFHIPGFRKIVYSIPLTGTEDLNTCFPLCMQRLFAKMQFSDNPCSTKELTTSFGWNDRETFTQHDVQEFCTVLLDKLSEKLKGTPLENSLSKLLEGKYKSYIRCVNVLFESSRIENFFDLSMVVQGVHTLEESFQKYIESEQLNGSNQYRTEKYGLQDAIMGTEFLKFPPVLHVHLRRFQFDYDTLRMTKINDRFEFPLTIDLSPYTADKSENEDLNYDLYGVLVHNGRIGGGHYYAYLRTSTSPQWYKFNDSHVSKSTEFEAIEDNFGGVNSMNIEKTYSAYMLIYIKRSESEELMKPVDENEIPERLINYAKKDTASPSSSSNEDTQDYTETPLKSVEITVYSENCLSINSLQNIPGFMNDKLKKVITISKEEPITRNMIYEKVAKEFSFNLDTIRLWEFANTPYSVFFDDDTEITSHNLTLFLQSKSEQASVSLTTIPDPVISLVSVHMTVIFAKFFHPLLDFPIQYIGSIEMKPDDEILQIFPLICNIVDLPENSDLVVFEESSGFYRQVDPTFQPSASNYCFVFQLNPGEVLPDSKYEWITSQKVIDNGIINSFDDDYKKEFEKTHGIIESESFTIYKFNEVMETKLFETVDDFYRNKKNQIVATLYDYFDLLNNKLLQTKIIFPNTISLLELKQFISRAIKINNKPIDESENNEYDFNFDPLHNTLNIYKAVNNSPRCIEPCQDPIDLPDNFPNLSSEFYNIKNPILFFQFLPNIPQDLSLNYFAIRMFISTKPYVVTEIYATVKLKDEQLETYEIDETAGKLTLEKLKSYVINSYDRQFWEPLLLEIKNYKYEIEETDTYDRQKSSSDDDNQHETDQQSSTNQNSNFQQNESNSDKSNEIQTEEEKSSKPIKSKNKDDLSLKIEPTQLATQDSKASEIYESNPDVQEYDEEFYLYNQIMLRSYFSIIENHIIISSVGPETIIDHNMTLRMDFLSNNDLYLLHNKAIIVSVSQISENSWQTFGVPFNIIIEKDEMFETVKKKLFTALSEIYHITNNEFIRLSFFFGGADRYEAAKAGKEKKLLWNGVNAYEEAKKTQCSNKIPILYILHKSKQSSDRSIKIYN